LITHICTSKCFNELIFVDFMVFNRIFKGFYKLNFQSLKPCMFWAAGGRPTCIDVHRL